MTEEEALYKKIVQKDKVLHHSNGEIVAIANNVYQVILFAQPKRKIFTTSIEKAYEILTDTQDEKTVRNDLMLAQS